MKFSRRGFIGAAAGATAGAATSKALLKGVSQITALTTRPIKPPGGPEQHLKSMCSECSSGCGTSVRLVGDRAVSLGGNPFNPINRGGLCPRGLAGLQAHYHPERLMKPGQYRQSDGSSKMVETGWDEAIDQIVSRLNLLHSEGKPHRIAILHSSIDNTLGRLIDRFLKAFGSPNNLRIHPIPAAQRAAWELTQGLTHGVAYDIERAGMVLSFGAGILDGWGSPGRQLHAFGAFRRERSEQRGRLIQIEPRMSVTGSKADEWITLNPGTERILALGLASILINERLYDTGFVESHTYGFNEWRDDQGAVRQGFRNWVTGNYSLTRVATETGVSAETILRVARSLPRNTPAVAIAGRSVALQENGVSACWAIHVLNALLGSVDVEGGVMVPLPVPYAEFPQPQPDSIAEAGLRNLPINTRTDRIVSEIESSPLAGLLNSVDDAEPPVDLLMVIECDPVALSPAPSILKQVLERIPMVIAVSPHSNETTQYADIVLPSPSVLERWDDASTPPMVPFTVCAMNRPIMPERGEGRHPGDLLLEIGHRLGGAVASALPWEDFPSLMRDGFEGLYDARRGDVFGSPLEEIRTRLMQRAGWWAPSFKSADELWTQIQERGGWWDSYYYPGEWRRVLQTPSGRFDLSPVLQESPPTESAEDTDSFPLLLYPFEVLALGNGQFIDMPFLQTLIGPHFDGPVDGWVEIHPKVAEAEGLKEGDRVSVESSSGKVEVRLRLFKGLHPELAAMPLGMGRTVGRWVRGWGVNPLELIEAREDLLTGDLCEYGTRVRISRV